MPTKEEETMICFPGPATYLAVETAELTELLRKIRRVEQLLSRIIRSRIQR